MKSLSIREQKGSTAALALMIMAAMMIMGTTYMVVTNSEMRAAAGSRNGIAAQHLAESGALLAFNRLSSDSGFRAGSNSMTGIVQDSSGTKNSGTTTAGTFRVTTNNGTSNTNYRKIVSVATVGSSTRTVVVTAEVRPTSLNNYSIFAGNGLRFDLTGISIDTDNSTGVAFDRVGSNKELKWYAPYWEAAWKSAYGTGGVDAVGAIDTEWTLLWKPNRVYSDSSKTAAITERTMSSPAVTYTPNASQFATKATRTALPGKVLDDPNKPNGLGTITLNDGDVVYIDGAATIPTNTRVIVTPNASGGQGKATIYSTGNMTIKDGAMIGSATDVNDPHAVSTPRQNGEITMVSQKNVLIDSELSRRANSFANAMVFANGDLAFSDGLVNGNCDALNSIFISNGKVTSTSLLTGKLRIHNLSSTPNIKNLIDNFNSFNPTPSGSAVIRELIKDIDN